MSGGARQVEPGGVTASPNGRPSGADAVLNGGGEMGALMRAFDWSATPLGPVADWPQSLKTIVGVVLANPFPMLIWWGPELRHLYNNAYRPMLGAKHPAIGQPGGEVWAEIWDIVGPRAHRVLSGGDATYDEDLLLPMERYGYVEETYFTFSYSPIPEPTAPAGIGGVLVTVTETTGRVLGERRMRALRDLGARAAEAKTVEEACAIAAETIAAHAHDIPFALLYVLDRGVARLRGSVRLSPGSGGAPLVVDLAAGDAANSIWPLADVLTMSRPRTVADVVERVGAIVGGPWPEAPNSAIVLPIPSAIPDQPAGALVAGVSPRLALDEGYRGFLEVVANQVGIAIGNARAHEEERRRAEALAELDRAKTQFFSNVSHEFRTPLTLLLGPLEAALQRRDDVSTETHEDLTLAHRNALRLLKLVNTLLDFARIEAGRIDASYEPTDLALLTAELASNFRAAVETAGMRFVVDALPLAEPVYVDRDMWEKIILNLLSNAFKHTFKGEIVVRVRADDRHAEVTIADTGVGIPAHQLPRIFERFHRVPNARSRTHEGTGIGLALVQELVRRHGGSIRVTSEEGVGTTFTIAVPFGSAHLPRERVNAPSSEQDRAPTSLGAALYVEEALRWLPGDAPDADRSPAYDHGLSDNTSDTGTAVVTVDESGDTSIPSAAARILLADDNADMRDYVTRLLEREGFVVEAVADGHAALAAARTRIPDLVLSDVMMPGLGGVDVLRELRADPRTSGLPVILLSARAGEEARVEGAESGADDYLVKPFSAQELVARVGVHVRLARTRRDAELALRRRTAQFETLVDAAPLGVYLIDSDFRIRQVNPIARPVFGDVPDLVGRDFDEVMHILWSPEYADEIVRLFRHTLETGEPYVTPERIEARRDRGVTEYYEWQTNRIALPDGGYGVVCYFRDISSHVQARDLLDDARQQAEEAKLVAEAANKTKSEFLAAMSHELRTPLNAIGGYSQLMEMGVNGPVTDGQLEALGRIRKSQQRLLALINDVLNFAKLEAGRVEYQIEPLDLAEVVSGVTQLVEPQIAAKGLAFETRVAPGTIVHADGDKVQQILLNLLTNAIKFTDRGGRITIDTSERDGADDAFAYLRVSDTGIGINRDKQHTIFDPFVQIHRSLARSTEGTGLGLAISRDLARGMGGELRVRSEEGKGATFTVNLPRVVARQMH